MLFWIQITFGVGVAVLTVYALRDGGRTRESRHYSVLLPIVAAFYLLFALLGDIERLDQEVAIFSAFALIGWLARSGRVWLLTVGFIVHGILDLFQFVTHFNRGVPEWWPPFCVSYDFLIALYLFYWQQSEAHVRRIMKARSTGR